MAILKKFIGANQVDGSKVLLDNQQSLRAKKANGDAQDLLKLDADGVLQLQLLPQVSSDPTDDKDLARKKFVDDSIQTKVLDKIGAISGSGIAPLVDGRIPNSFYSSLVITDVFVVADIAARDALSEIEEGDVAKVLDAGAGLPKTYIFGGSNWIEIESGSDVDTVNGQTGTVVLTTSEISEGSALYFTDERAKSAAVANSITEGIEDVAPSQDAVFQALAAAAEAVADEDATFLKLDGSRAMAGFVKFGTGLISSAVPATWVNALGVDVSAGTLTQTSEFGWGPGARTVQKLLRGQNGYIEFTVGNISQYQSAVMVGLTPAVVTTYDYSSIGWGLYVNHANNPDSTYVEIYESGTLAFTGPEVTDQDVFRVEVNGSVVQYKVNGSVIYTSLNPLGMEVRGIAAIAGPGNTATAVFASEAMDASLGAPNTGDFSLYAKTYLDLDPEIAIRALANIEMGYHTISGLGEPTNDQDAATKFYADAQRTGAVSDANEYTDGQLDGLSLQELVHLPKTLGAGDLVSITVADTIVGQPWIQVGRVSLVPGDDFTIDGATITWAGTVAQGQDEALSEGDKVSIFYMKAVTPFA